MATLTFHGHSCFSLLTDEGTRILFDPWLDGNPVADIEAKDVEELDFILVSHGHSDHFADCIGIAKKTDATVVSTFELVSFVQSQGVKNGHGMNIGGAHAFPFGKVKLTAALHTGSIDGDKEGAFTTDCCGFLVTLNGGTRLYFAGDTALIMDMQLLRGQVDVALLPIGDNYTMGPEDAARAVEFIEPKTVVPMHYDTFPLIAQDPEAFRRKLSGRAKVQVMKPGDTFDI
ncbi:MAG TPA: metal-dependent hydrolase [Longimicrobiaceae bacterium]|jgi:L-ascorbate metabolism protein UlaG (beta-lactamase superfamily)|nr:metal-dependent hydrolase [Longimicrobiaceae bacterium]